MGKAEFGTPKWISNNLKSKGLQKLRWFCQMCSKQCRDENGFKCHTSSEAHQRQLLLFAEKPGQFLGSFSAEFERDFMNQLKRCHGTKRVYANQVYQEYIKEKDHVHMNATKWVTLTGFVKYLGKTGKCVVDETEKGWYITWIDRDPETIARQEAANKKEKMTKDDDEKMAEFIKQQVEKAAKKQDDEEEKEKFTELQRSADDEKIQLKDFKLSAQKSEKVLVQNTGFQSKSGEKSDRKIKDQKQKRKVSALEEIIREEEAEKKKKIKNDPWIRKGIVVKVVTKSLGDKYYKQKGYIKDIHKDDPYVAIVVMNTNGAKVKLDQDHLETVIPAVGKNVMILKGRQYRGSEAMLLGLNVDQFSADLKVQQDGEEITLPYEHFSKIHVNS